MASKQAGWRIYKQQMGLLDHGDALWEPAPIHSYKRVKFGDVGYIRRGRFHLLFSAGCPLGQRQPGVDVPSTFEPLDIGPIILSQPRLPGCLCTSTVKETGAGLAASVCTTPFLEPGVGFSFELTEKQGAALVTKYRTYREDIELESAFEEYTKRHYDSWVTFARNARHGNDIKPVLVTAVDMTRDFAMMAYSNNSTQLSSEFTTSIPLIASASASVWGTWRTRGLVHTNCGPQLCSPPPSPDTLELYPPYPTQADAIPNEYNQCVFIRYYTMRWRALMFPKVIRAASGPHDCGSGDNYDETLPELTVQSGTNSDTGSDTGGDSTTDYSSSVTSYEPELELFHNASSEDEDVFDIVAEYIFHNSEAEAALIHHREIAQMREGMPQTEMSELLSERQPDVLVDSTGVGRLVYRSRQVLPDMSPIVSRWQQLTSMDLQSPDFLPSLSSLTVEDNRFSTTNLCGDDARVTLRAIDEVFTDGKIPSEYERDTLCVMRTLAYNSGQVTPRYQVDRNSLSVEAGVISNGSCGDVRKGKLGDKTVAVKTLRIGKQTDHHEAQKLFCKECIIRMTVSHPNLLELIAVDINPLTGQCSMISEMMVNGNVMEYIRKNRANRHRLLEEAATGLRYLHKRGIVHGNLKGHNILITNETRACLADFGLSTLTPSTRGGTTTISAGGTPIYMAPELLSSLRLSQSNARQTQPVDIYALGVVIYEVLTGSQPFEEKKWAVSELMSRVVDGERPAKPGKAEQIGFGGGTWELVEGCWTEIPARRPTIDRVLTHLTRVAASSPVVDPTPERPRESADNPPEPDFSSKLYSLVRDNPHLDGQGQTRLRGPAAAITRPRARTIHSAPPVAPSTETGTSLSRSRETSKSTGTGTVMSAASTSMTSVSRNSGGSRRNVKLLFKLRKRPSPTSPARKLPFRRPILATKLSVDPEKVVNSTIPMPIPFARETPRSGFLGWRRFTDKLKPKRAVGFSTQSPQA